MVENDEGDLPRVSEKSLRSFYLDFGRTSPFVLIFYMIFSLGLYFINWVYLMNVRFRDSDIEGTPSPLWGLKFMFLVPFSWLLVLGVLRRFWKVIDADVLFWVDVVGWMIIMIMMLEYLYRFCRCFGQVTKTNGVVWYLFLWVGFFPLVLLPLGKMFFLPLLLFPLFTIPAMQYRLNFVCREYYG